jgi:hypothetical protein
MEFAVGNSNDKNRHGGRFLARARDRSGILFCRRQKRYKRIARSPAEPGMRPDSVKYEITAYFPNTAGWEKLPFLQFLKILKISLDILY